MGSPCLASESSKHTGPCRLSLRRNQGSPDQLQGIHGLLWGYSGLTAWCSDSWGPEASSVVEGTTSWFGSVGPRVLGGEGWSEEAGMCWHFQEEASLHGLY